LAEKILRQNQFSEKLDFSHSLGLHLTGVPEFGFWRGSSGHAMRQLKRKDELLGELPAKRRSEAGDGEINPEQERKQAGDQDLGWGNSAIQGDQLGFWKNQ
jgi:hypothetical protein